MDVLSGCFEPVGIWLQEHQVAIEVGMLSVIGILAIYGVLSWRARRRMWREIRNLRTDTLADLHALHSRLDKIENVEFRARKMMKAIESRSGEVLDAVDGRRGQQESDEGCSDD